MSQASQEAESLVLPMGEPGMCFQNSIALVLANPKRLLYVQGFYICEDGNGTQFINHAWVKDMVTGERHEVTIRDVEPDARYVGKEFAADELWVPSPGLFIQQLTLEQEEAMLTAAGYKVALSKEFFDEGGWDYVWVEAAR